LVQATWKSSVGQVFVDLVAFERVTRELAVQVAEEVAKLAFFKRGVRELPIYGGQARGLRNNIRVIIICGIHIKSDTQLGATDRACATCPRNKVIVIVRRESARYYCGRRGGPYCLGFN
jgi:hypothetical protein